MDAEIVGEIIDVEIIATGHAIREHRRLEKSYGPGRWRKLKGTAMVRLPDGLVSRAEVHWYEAHGQGRRNYASSACYANADGRTQLLLRALR